MRKFFFLCIALTIKDKRTNIPSQKYNKSVKKDKKKIYIVCTNKGGNIQVAVWKTRHKGWKASDK